MDIAPIRSAPLPLEKAGKLDERAAREAAQQFEATFIAEMLKVSGVNAMPESFGGGAGEDAFASFLTQEYGRLMAENGGIGLAEAIFQSITQGGRAP